MFSWKIDQRRRRMNRTLIVALSVLMLAGPAFAGQPEVKEATITPTELGVGDSVKIVVEFTGEKGNIKEIFGYAREYPYDSPRITLFQDEDSKKNIWKVAATVPWDAPSETFHLDFTAVDKEGKEIVSKDMPETAIGKTFTLILTVKE
jgi:GH15 family glucan-1,4-alpha-glucosidase